MSVILHFLGQFFAGAFLCNAVPHAVSGLQGRPFPTPFAKPPGQGDSSPLVNFLWGFANFLAGAALLHFTPVTPGLNLSTLTALVGALFIGVQMSRHFGRVQSRKREP